MKRMMMVVLGLSVMAAAGCGKSNEDICEDGCKQGNACAQAIAAQAAPGVTITPEDCTTICANADSSSAASSCSNTGAYDSCLTGVDATNASTCSADLQACSSKC